jgi:hypothetical protein
MVSLFILFGDYAADRLKHLYYGFKVFDLLLEVCD